jgi:hypothetical protein
MVAMALRPTEISATPPRRLRRAPSILARDDPEALGGLASPGALVSPKKAGETERRTEDQFFFMN